MRNFRSLFEILFCLFIWLNSKPLQHSKHIRKALGALKQLWETDGGRDLECALSDRGVSHRRSLSPGEGMDAESEQGRGVGTAGRSRRRPLGGKRRAGQQ